MEMCDRKCMFGDKSTVKTCPKKVNKKKYIFVIKQGTITHSFNAKSFTFYIPFKNIQDF